MMKIIRPYNLAFPINIVMLSHLIHYKGFTQIDILFYCKINMTKEIYLLHVIRDNKNTYQIQKSSILTTLFITAENNKI